MKVRRERAPGRAGSRHPSSPSMPPGPTCLSFCLSVCLVCGALGAPSFACVCDGRGAAAVEIPGTFAPRGRRACESPASIAVHPRTAAAPRGNVAAVGWGFRSLSYLWRRRRSPSVAVVRVGVWVGSWCGLLLDERSSPIDERARGALVLAALHGDLGATAAIGCGCCGHCMGRFLASFITTGIMATTTPAGLQTALSVSCSVMLSATRCGISLY